MKNEFDYLNDVKMDFSIYEKSELTDLERVKMKKLIKNNKKINRGKILGLAACIATVAIFSQTVFAKELFVSILKTVSTGHNHFSVVDSSNLETKLPKEAVGLIFDKDGKKAKTYQQGVDYYDKDGNKIEDYEAFLTEHLDSVTIESEDGKVKVSLNDKASNDPLAHAKECGYPIIDDISKINDYLSFTAQLPEYLPEGFTFYGASAYGTDYLFVFYMNDANEYLMLHERIINEETAFSTGTDGTIEEIDINGNKAVLMDDRSIDWECDGISVGFNSRGCISRDELLKVAKSIK